MSVRLAVVALVLAAISFAACGGSDAGGAHGGTTGVSAVATLPPTKTPTPAPRRAIAPIVADGVRPTDTPTATPTATNTPEPTATRVPAPTQPPPRPVYAQAGEWSDSVEQWRGLVCSYGWNCEDALRRINCESGGNAYAVNPTSGACGLWQHLPCEAQGDPIASTALAWAKYQARGWAPWVCT